jgi:membrane associated rhomboid family serine protease
MTPWVTRLIIANVVMFILTMIAPAMTDLLILVPALIVVRPWTLVSYMFLHAGLWHLLFNMLGLYFFGPRLELELGGKHFILLYMISGIAGGLLSFVTPSAAILGASGAVFGVLLGFARYWPRDSIYLWGILPIEARWLVVIMAVLSLIGGFGGSRDHIAHFAHLGGFLGGYLFLRWRDGHTRAARFQTMMSPTPVTGADVQRWNSIDRKKLHEVNRAELDRVLAKLDSSGVAGLTESEKEFLDRFSSH